jgi:hypothetical protein
MDGAAHTTEALCSYCQSIFHPLESDVLFFSEQGDQIRIRWHPDIKSLRTSVGEGCELCVNVWEEILDSVLADEERLPHLVDMKAMISIRDEERFSELTCNTVVGNLVFHIPLDNDKNVYVMGSHCLRCSITPGKHAIRSSSFDNQASTKDLTIAKQWVEDCLATHATCRKITSRAMSMPSRLISIHEEQGSLRAKLLEGDEIMQGCAYVTLSHRWGSRPTVLLESATRYEFKTKIPVEQLSLTFQDALAVTLRMGHSLIWIDSLCILQDSQEDWAKECQLMADIYERAILNIAATAFSSSNQGLFVTKRSRTPRPLNVEVVIPMLADHIAGTYDLVHKRAWKIRVDDAPLNRRGWVLQERFLSPRILHFGKDQLLWECQEMQIAESISFVDSLSICSNRTDGSCPYRNLLTLDTSIPAERCLARDAWYELIEQYTRSQLTYESDRFPAIAGITARFRSILNDKCIAGLWEKTLPEDLLWRRLIRKEYDRRDIAESQLPTWSWAGLSCAIAHIAKTWDTSTAIHHQNYHFSDDSRCLFVQGLLLKGFCKAIQATMSVWELKLLNTDSTINISLDERPGDLDNISTPLAVHVDHTDRSENPDDNSGTERILVTLLCVRSEPYVTGLVLKSINGRGCYSRIGLFQAGTVHTYDAEKESVVATRSSLRPDRHWDQSFAFTEDEYIESYGEGLYSIVIR